MGSLTQKTMEMIYIMHVLNSFVKTVLFQYCTVQYCTVHSQIDNFEYKNGFLGPENP